MAKEEPGKTETRVKRTGAEGRKDGDTQTSLGAETRAVRATQISYKVIRVIWLLSLILWPEKGLKGSTCVHLFVVCALGLNGVGAEGGMYVI